MAGYGLGRILTSQNAAGAESSDAHDGHSLGASLEAGHEGAANTGARAASTQPTAQLPSSRRAHFARPRWKPTAGVGRGSATQLSKHSVQTSLL